MIVNTFTGKTTAQYAAFDFETRTMIDGWCVPEETIRAMCADKDHYPLGWWRKHAEVVCWAWIVYTPDGFAIAETFEEWMQVIQDAGIKTGWFYNAPFDFTILDYAMLSRGWEYVEKAKQPKTYAELCSNFGARYSMDIVAPYLRKKGDRSRRQSWKVTLYDLRNILHGGLANLLRDFDVKDGEGRPLRKLEMDYQQATGDKQEEIDYMKADAEGLWWLIHTAGAMLSDRYGLDIRHGKPDVLTASGLAKRVFLSRLYPRSKTYSHAIRSFKHDHPMGLESDQWFRAGGLLQGGLPVINEDYAGRTLTGISANRYDVNSEYPYYMSRMRSVCGMYSTHRTLEEAQLYYGVTGCYILVFSRLIAICKPEMVPSWRDPYTGKIVQEFRHTADRGQLMIFLEEYEELKFWYDIITEEIEMVVAYQTRPEPAIWNTVKWEYAEKTEARRSGQKVRATFPKLVMNGYGGKYSQNPHHDVVTRELAPEGYTRLVCTGEDTDEAGLMHVVQGARITAAGRMIWRRWARLICDGKVRERLLYGDTDSFHVLAEAPGQYVDAEKLGYLKKENATPIVRACFLAPKTYFEEEASGKLELHAKGVHIEAIEELIRQGTPVEKIYTKGFTIQTTSAVNVKGGKALLPLPKIITRPDLFPDETYL